MLSESQLYKQKLSEFLTFHCHTYSGAFVHKLTIRSACFHFFQFILSYQSLTHPEHPLLQKSSCM